MPLLSFVTPRRIWWIAASALWAALLNATAHAQPAPGAEETSIRVARTAHPAPRLGRGNLQGDDAVRALGSHLSAVAAAYGKTPTALVNLLRQDRLMRLDARGRLFVVDEIPPDVAASLPDLALQPAASPAAAPLYKLTDTFKLHSNPTAKRTIYLNFKGANLTGTAWAAGGKTVTAPPFTLDGDNTTFTDTELTRIQAIWQRVAEDYAPLAVDVTTEAPAADRLQRSSSTDDVYGTTVVITNNTNVYSCSCGGIAYVGVFDDTSEYYKPALVFHNMLGNSEKSIAEAISHEAGHNVGLSHDGSASTEYYAGQGSGATSWAPIMGVGYYKNVVQWSKGEYSGANNLEDDFAVMRTNGLPIRADDHGNTPSTATALTAVVGADGVTTLSSAISAIESQSDVDAFWFTAPAGATLKLTVRPVTVSPNLDVAMTIQNSAGQRVQINPAGSLSASVTVVLPATDRYTVLVSGAGYGNPAVDGYSKYGSVGYYIVNGTVTPAP